MLNKTQLKELQEYVEIHLNVVTFSSIEKWEESDILESIQNIEIEDFIKNNRKPTFNQTLFSYIDKTGMTDSDLYKKAGIDRRHF